MPRSSPRCAARRRTAPVLGRPRPKKPEDTVSLAISGACTGGPVILDGVIEIDFKDYVFKPLPKRPGGYCLEEIDTLKPPSGHGDDTVATTVPTRSGSGVKEVQDRIRYGEGQIDKALAASHVPAGAHVVHSYQTLPSGVPNEDAGIMR
ncbi:hypothetical protein GCM10010317_007290 [Streptomyces mirabilis]|jgi:hypothetical protein|uniref:hypothetical protein n=1 Tax=Streptomyces mirabilis TaxID=68239 RepID=UPI00167DF5AD|nr:hypothetical protein [Streptomyces mirabilis]GHD39124.1 hypothetical protein GCM10010317_007290 [Streptomyces mirabilis]